MTENEVESVLFGKPHLRFIEQGNVTAEDVYAAMGQTEPGGRYLIVFFVAKADHSALVVSARDMSAQERRAYERR